MTWGYRGLTQTAKIEKYTRQTLLVLLVLMPALFMPTTVVIALDHGQTGWLIGVAGLMLAGLWVMWDFCRTWQPPSPSQRLLLGGIALPTALLIRAWDAPSDVIAGAALALAWTYAWPRGGLRGPRDMTLMVGASTVMAGIATSSHSSGPWYADASAGALIGLLVAAFSLFTVRLSAWTVDVVRQLDDAREVQASLAVAEERLRFSRDVHDVLGRHLSTIAITSELAATLARRGDAGAADKMLEVRGYAHDALRETRELARGYRAPDLQQELDGARTLLSAAGITADLNVHGVPPEWQELAALTVREGVTNVLRHSQASRVDVHWDGTSLHLINDGLFSPGEVHQGDSKHGSGLAGLSERVEPHGGRIDTTQDADQFRLSLTTPVVAP